jgi:hypothetical protein
MRSRISWGSWRSATAPLERGACQLTWTIGAPSSQGTVSNSWMADPVTLDSLVAPGPEPTPRLTQCCSSGVPQAPASRADFSSR